MKKIHLFNFLLFLFFSSKSFAQKTNSVELIKLNADKNNNTTPITKMPSGSKIAVIQDSQVKVADSTSVYMIIPKQYNSETMDSKPQ